MTWHTMVLTEPHPQKADFVLRYLGIVDVSMSGTAWIWQQVNHAGSYVGSPSAPFSTENDALDDALKTLNGDRWE